MITAHSARSIRRRGSSSDGKNDPDAQLRDPQLDVTGRGRQQPRTGTRCAGSSGSSVRSCGAAPIAAVSSASISSCIPASSSRRNNSFGVTLTEPREQLRNSAIIVMGHRVVLLNELLGRFSPRVTRWPTHQVDRPPTYTTSRDANLPPSARSCTPCQLTNGQPVTDRLPICSGPPLAGRSVLGRPRRRCLPGAQPCTAVT